MVLAVLLCLIANVVAEEAQDSATVSTVQAGDTEVRVATLLDTGTTNEMHDDTTLLRSVRVMEDETGLILFDAIRFWIGGAVQFDYYNFDGIYNHADNGERSEGGSMRRLEGTLRAALYDWGEIKAQYDFDDGIFRDLYLRWVSERRYTPLTITVGNQIEPMGLDQLTGNKFGIAQESSAPSHAFATWRSLGVRLHKAFQIERADRPLDIFDDEAAFVTTSVGVFTQDMDESHDTDLAVTGRVTAGRVRDGIALHVGLSGSYREGDFDRIRLRPEVQEAERITLARPEANTQGIVGLEGVYNNGPLHVQAEAYYSNYRGRVDGYGGGGYFQGGWFLTGDSRGYNARWGTLAALRQNGRFAVELFGRISHTRGSDDISGWNDYKSVTVGSNFWHRKFRGSINLLYGSSREPVDTEDDGMALVVRAQYLL
jgi:phosphate-selective porin